MLTKGAIGNLINRYKAVLKKCHIMNTFGSLAVAAMLTAGAFGTAAAADFTGVEQHNIQSPGNYGAWGSIDSDSSITDSTFIGNSISPTADKAWGMGGVLYFNGAPKDSGTTITITDSAFINNTANAYAEGGETAADIGYAAGGAFFNKGMTINLNDVEFSGNKAVSQADSNMIVAGGAIYSDAAINNNVGVKKSRSEFQHYKGYAVFRQHH